MKLGLFFGAGAEICYGLSNGGTFAIDLFRQDPTSYKEKLRRELNNININKTSLYATTWLPEGYCNKPIYAFGRNEFSSIIESSIQYKRDKIIEHLNSFDKLCEKVIADLSLEKDILNNKFRELSNCDIGNVLYKHKITINPILSKYNNC